MLAPIEIYEAFVQWHAYAELYERLCEGDPRTGDPRELANEILAVGHDRAAATIFAGGVIPCLEEARLVLDELLELTTNGRRPRYGREIYPDFYAQLTEGLLAPEHEGATSP